MNSKEIKTIIEICEQAGRKIMEVYNKTNINIEMKADDSPVTEADIAAHKIIKAGLLENFSDIPIISEEGQNRDKGTGKFFLVDPLDGTKSFIKKTDEFTVNVALIENNMPTIGVVYVPAQDVTYYSDGQNSYKIDAKGDEQKIECRTPPEEGMTVVASVSHRTPETNEFIAKYKVAEIIGTASSLKFCVVAEGAADLYPRLGRTMEWDTAAGQAVLQGAGGDVKTPEGEIFTYAKNDIFENGFFIASGKLD